MVEAGGFIDRDLAKEIENAGVDSVLAYGRSWKTLRRSSEATSLTSLHTSKETTSTSKANRLPDRVYYPVLKEILDQGFDWREDITQSSSRERTSSIRSTSSFRT